MVGYSRPREDLHQNSVFSRQPHGKLSHEIGSWRNDGFGSPIEEDDPEADNDDLESVVRHGLEEAR